ncbi:hypothetical protein NQD34_014045 [Periophthalmus magnuspinnatus]|nr:hypothetical protein NQD34_014045 [Periophthalmus magnuspinnatus]
MSGADGLEDEPTECAVAVMDQRISQLQNRHIILQKMQEFIRRDDDNEDANELELVEKELEELLQKKQDLLHQSCGTSSDTGQVGISHLYSKMKNEGAVYMLPPFHFTPNALPQPTGQNVPKPVPPEEPLPPPEEPPPPLEESPPPPEEPPPLPVEPSVPPEDPPPPPDETVLPPLPLESSLPEKEELQEEADDIKHIEPADRLGRGGAFTLCPNCEQVVFTHTKKFNGESVWLMSCIVSFVGLCLVPFCVDQLKSVHHMCPQCQATLHTYHPF